MLIQEEYFKNIFNTVRDAILILDEDMRVLSANRSFFRIFNVSSEDTIGSLLFDLGNGQWNIPFLRVLLEDILPKNDTVDDYEIKHNFESIGRKTMLLNACKIREKKNAAPIILLVIEDITERKRLEELVVESEERYRRIFETANDGIVLLEKHEGTIIHANPATEKMLGYAKDEYIGKKLQDIGVSLDMNDFPAVMKSLDESGILNYDDVQVKTKSGQYLDTDIYMVDRAKLAQCNIRDVTERKRAMEALCHSEKKFRDLLETINLLSAILDHNGNIIFCNDYLLELTGWTKDEVLDKNWFDLFLPVGIRETARSMFASGIAEGTIPVHFENVILTRDGKEKQIEWNNSLLRDKEQKILGVASIGTDVTEHKKLEDQLRHAQKMEAIGTLAGGIAHDFNNMLNVIMGYGSMVMDTLEAGSQAKEQMHEVLTAAERAANLTKRLLVFSRKQAAAVKSVNINEVLHDLQKMLARMIRESIDFTLDLGDRPLFVLADPGQIEQVLINLVTNAGDAMQEGGRLTISTGLEELNAEYVAAYGYGIPGRYALITVADTGQGMDAETQEKIFEPFFTTKGVGEGTGLGLSICYGIIKQHSGYIKVYSERGKGTVFKIFLPLSDEAASQDEAESAVTVRGGNETILIAEDEASLRKLTRIVLESFGYRVISAEDGEDAVTKFMENRERISLVLLDMIMPKKSGKEVSEEIRRVSPGIKILFASGYPMNNIMTRELSDAEIDFINKPFQPKDLLITVRGILDRVTGA